MSRFFLLFSGIVTLAIPIFAFAQLEMPVSGGLLPDPVPTFSPEVCPASTDYWIEGNTEVRIGTSQEYAVALPFSRSGATYEVRYTLRRSDETIETVTGQERYLRQFSTPGDAVIEAFLRLSDGCEATVSKRVRIYQTLIAYVSDDFSWVDEWLSDLMARRSILLKPIEVSAQWGFLDAGSPASDMLYKQWPSIRDADVVIVDGVDPIPVLGAIDRVRSNSSNPISFHEKRVYVVSEIRANLLGKLLASSVKPLWLSDVGVLPPGSVMGFLVSMNTTEGASAQAEMILYAEPSRFYSLGGLLEYLSYEGFSVSFLGLLLSIALATLALNILKQIVGTYVFGVYNPILLALSVTVAGGRFSMLFLGIAFVAVLATGFFAKRFYLLYNAKRALLISLYIFFAIISIAALRAFWVDGFVSAAFANPFALFPVFLMVMVADKVFQEDIDVFSRGGVVSLVQFTVVSVVAFLVLDSIPVRYFLLSYPDILLLIAVFNLAVGRYTGLQFFEYVRFLPVIGKLREEE